VLLTSCRTSPLLVVPRKPFLSLFFLFSAEVWIRQTELFLVLSSVSELFAGPVFLRQFEVYPSPFTHALFDQQLPLLVVDPVFLRFLLFCFHHKSVLYPRRFSYLPTF